MTEDLEAVALANRVLDQPNIDADGDICILARQLLRTREKLACANTGGLPLLYAIRAALGWNDKTSLSILDRGVRDLKAAHDALLASCSEFFPILSGHLDMINPGGAAEPSQAFQVAKARVERMRAAIAKARSAA